jgi:hypothetical protein
VPSAFGGVDVWFAVMPRHLESACYKTIAFNHEIKNVKIDSVLSLPSCVKSRNISTKAVG